MNIQKSPHDIIIKPVVSEKGYANSDRGQYTFVVDPRATKPEIKQAVEAVFKVKVDSVNTLRRRGKVQRYRYGMGKRADTKHAIVTLARGQQIDIFGNNN